MYYISTKTNDIEYKLSTIVRGGECMIRVIKRTDFSRTFYKAFINLFREPMYEYVDFKINSDTSSLDKIFNIELIKSILTNILNTDKFILEISAIPDNFVKIGIKYDDGFVEYEWLNLTLMGLILDDLINFEYLNNPKLKYQLLQ